MPVLGEQVRKVTTETPKATLVKPVADSAIGLIARMGGPLNSQTIEPGPDGPTFAHTRFVDTRMGVSYSSNGLRSVGEDGEKEHGQGLLVAQAEPMLPINPDSTDARVNKRFPLNLAPFTLRTPTTQVGLQVAEFDRRATVHHEEFVARPHLLDRGTILVATLTPDAEFRQHEEIALPVEPRRRRLTEHQQTEWNRKNAQERKFSLTTLDALIDDATTYMTDMNAAGPKQEVYHRQAINHVLGNLTTPEPSNEVLINRRLVAQVPTNVNPEALYRRFAKESMSPVYSEITGVTYTQAKSTFLKINRWVNQQLNAGANELTTYYEATRRIIQSRMQARSEMQRGERVTVDQMIEDAARASTPPTEVVFPPLPDVTFFSPWLRDSAAENLAHYAQERESAQVVYRRRPTVSTHPRLATHATVSLMEHSRPRK